MLPHAWHREYPGSLDEHPCIVLPLYYDCQPSLFCIAKVRVMTTLQAARDNDSPAPSVQARLACLLVYANPKPFHYAYIIPTYCNLGTFSITPI